MTPTDLPVLTIDGDRVDDLESFTREFSTFLDDHTWRGNLDAFNDILRGGFGTPEGGFVLRWVNSDRSRQTLGWDATIRWYEENLKVCHPDNRADVRARLDRARKHEGTTLFDWLVDIIRIHGPGGRESEDRVHLDLR
ncbi:barstar family protein [Kibdelosporangium lantanae]|uniref:Barstar family protein n=1 Tax=Kibdelosporangium lantanae TaxID=1497396 RepID=A0ABW3MFB3_9PSEU